jgi:hypothetical protein
MLHGSQKVCAIRLKAQAKQVDPVPTYTVADNRVPVSGPQGQSQGDSRRDRDWRNHPSAGGGNVLQDGYRAAAIPYDFDKLRAEIADFRAPFARPAGSLEIGFHEVPNKACAISARLTASGSTVYLPA